jgi:hypothetical protein
VLQFIEELVVATKAIKLSSCSAGFDLMLLIKFRQQKSSFWMMRYTNPFFVESGSGVSIGFEVAGEDDLCALGAAWNDGLHVGASFWRGSTSRFCEAR